MLVPRMTYDALVAIFGEEMTRRYYTPFSFVRH